VPIIGPPPVTKAILSPEIILPNATADPSMLRQLPRLKLIATRRAPGGTIHPAQTAGEFWKEYDAGQAAGKK
jgi:hypothetical protein